MAPLRIIQSAVLAAAFAAGAPCARADIYTWVDATGTTNVSNIAPPEGTRVTRVLKTSAAKPADSESERDATVRVLTERVRQLQDEVESARRPPPPPPYAYSVPVPPAQYAAATMPPPAPYYESASTEGPGAVCDPGYQYCGPAWGYAGIPAIILWSAPYVRHFHGVRGSPRAFAPRPGRMQGGGRRR